jgi:hypothetical protein
MSERPVAAFYTLARQNQGKRPDAVRPATFYIPVDCAREPKHQRVKGSPMPVWRLQASWQLDSAAPRDRVTITPHFNDVGATTDPQNLCDDLLAGLQALKNCTGEVRVKAYDAQGSVPVYPQGDAIVQAGAVQGTTTPRELAVCLSFYGERNVPRQRGRLYIPTWFTSHLTGSLRPTNPNAVMAALPGLFAGLGGPDVDWCVYSRKLDHAFSVTDWWCDNEWDVVRSRGMRPTSRITGTTTEAGLKGVEVPLQ